MSRSRSVALGTLAWVLIVLTCATGVWLVIDRVGRDVLSPAPAAVEAPRDRFSAATPTEAPGSATPSASQTPTPSAASPTSTRLTPATPSTTRGQRPPTGATSPVPPPPPPPGPAAPQTPSPPTHTNGAVAVAGGRVGATCTGNQVSLSFATPESGWSFTVENEPDHLAVHFVATNGNGDTAVSARCLNGAPVFDSSETGGSGDG